MAKKKKKIGIGKIVLIVLAILIVTTVVVVKVAINKIADNAEIKELSADYQTGTWYHVTPTGAVDSTGKQWHGLVRFGTENKVVINFYGGGVSINEDTAKEGEDFYFHTMGDQEFAQNIGISAYDSKNPLKDWTFINIPYCTGDWHIGTNDFPYTDKDAVLVTGWSGGGFGASFLAEEIFSDYFPETNNRTVLVDAAFLLNDDWKEIADNVWGTPAHIAERFTGDNIVLDSLQSLSTNITDAKILFLCSVRDSALTQYQNYLNGETFEATEETGKVFESNLKVMVNELLTLPNSSVFIWSDKETDTELTGHTVTMIQFVDAEYGGVKVSDWLMDAIEGNLVNHGLDLLSDSN